MVQLIFEPLTILIEGIYATFFILCFVHYIFQDNILKNILRAHF